MVTDNVYKIYTTPQDFLKQTN